MSLVSAGSMEYCRRWGIAQKVRTAVWSEHHALDFVYMETLAGRELARIKVPSYAAGRPAWTPEGMCQCPQIYFDPILAARVGELERVTRLYDTALEVFRQDADGVVAELAGIDGRRSTIRAALSRRLRRRIEHRARGARHSARGRRRHRQQRQHLLPLARRSTSLHDKGWARIYRPIDEDGCWSELIPIDGRELWRLTVFDDPRYEDDPRAALRRMAGFDVPARDHLDAAVGAARQRGGTATAAAASGSPATARTSPRRPAASACTPAWRRRSTSPGSSRRCSKGWGGPRLLTSYEAERKPIADRNIDLSTETYRALRSIPPPTSPTSIRRWRTTRMPSYSIPDHVRSCPSYDASPICVDDGTPPLPRAPATHIASTRPGARAPHAWLGEGRSTLDLFGDGFVLLQLGPAAPDVSALRAAAARRGVPLRVETITDPDIARLYEKPLVLVRPDLHVAWRGSAVPADRAWH